MRKLSHTALQALAILALSVAPLTASAQQANANQLKAAIVYNIIRFVQFPLSNDREPLHLCLDREVSGGRELAALNGLRVGNRTIVQRTLDADNAQGCDVAYLGRASAADIARVRNRGVLVMGENANFIGAGGTIGLVRMGNQIRFEVNTRAARQAQIVISSKLLRLAARIEP